MEGAASQVAASGRQPNRVQVSSNKKPLQFYLNLSRRIMAEHGEVELSALGLAVSNMVTIAEILKKEGWAVEKSLRTGLETLDGEGDLRSTKPKMEVVLSKSADFDRLLAEHPPPPRGPKPAPAAEAVAA